jgi:hypothetical protein
MPPCGAAGQRGHVHTCPAPWKHRRAHVHTCPAPWKHRRAHAGWWWQAHVEGRQLELGQLHARGQRDVAQDVLDCGLERRVGLLHHVLWWRGGWRVARVWRVCFRQGAGLGCAVLGARTQRPPTRPRRANTQRAPTCRLGSCMACGSNTGFMNSEMGGRFISCQLGRPTDLRKSLSGGRLTDSSGGRKSCVRACVCVRGWLGGGGWWVGG